MRQVETPFCPDCQNLILHRPACPQCGWQRPPATDAAGSVAWQQEVAGKAGTDLTRAGDLLLFGTEDGVIYAHEAGSGEERWTVALPEDWVPARAIAATDDTVFVTVDDMRPLGTNDKALLALRLADGEELWRYETTAKRLSPAAVHDDTVYVAASDRVLHAVDVQSGRERWQAAIPGWNRHAPADGSGLLFFGTQAGPNGPAILVALDADDGSEQWRAEGESTLMRPVVAEDSVFAAGWKGTLSCFDARTGDVRWEQSPGIKIPVAPAVHDSSVLVANRDRQGYHLLALTTERGETIWSYSLPADEKLHTTPLVHQGLVYVGTSDRRKVSGSNGRNNSGRLHALDVDSGEPVWPAPIDLEERIKHTPALDRHRLYVLTRYGLLWAIAIREPEPLREPAAYEAEGDLEGAATAFVRQGAFAEAGRLYVELGEPYKAAQLYQQAGEQADEDEARRKWWLRAGELYEAAERWERARHIYRELDEPVKVAGISIAQGEYRQAAVLYEQADAYRKAGELYERVEEWSKAGQMYERVGDWQAARRCYAKQGAQDKEAEALMQTGAFEEAAQMYAQLGQRSRAAELYIEAEKPATAAELYREMGAWEQARRLYEQIGRTDQVARCHEELGDELKAAQLYEQAAQTLEAEEAPDEEIADLYGRAADLYQRRLQEHDHARCREKVIHYRRLPVLSVEARGEFVVGEFNLLRVTLRNEGSGPARQIRLAIDGEYEGDLKKSHPGLLPGKEATLQFRLKPRESGEHTPLDIEVRYADDTNAPLPSTTIESTVPVASERHIRGSTPFGFAAETVVVEQLVAPSGTGTQVKDSAVVRSQLGGGADVAATPPEGKPAAHQIEDSVVVGDRGRSGETAQSAASEHRWCSACNAELDQRQPTCPECESYYCPSCYNTLTEEQRKETYCLHCGTALDDASFAEGDT